MEKKGNRRIGLIYASALLLIVLSIAARMLFILADRRKADISYLDPKLSDNLIRGTIYDRNGSILAIQAPHYGFSVKSRSQRAGYISSVLSPYIRCSIIESEEMLRSGSGFIELKNIPTSGEISTINRLIDAIDASGEIEFQIREERLYPLKEAVSLIGSVDEVMNGRSGLEAYADSLLSAKPVLGYSSAYGSSITTTLDSDLQAAVENIALLKDDDANNLTAAVFSSNGEVLAWHGKGSPGLYQNLILSVSTENSYTPLFPSFPSERLRNESAEADPERTYFIYSDAPDKETEEAISDDLLSILKTQGRIRSQIQ